LFPLFIFNEVSSCPESLDYPLVIVGKCNLSYFNLKAVFGLVALVFNLAASLFKLVLDVDLELAALVEQTAFVEVVGGPVVVLTGREVKFNSVVSRRDSLHVPFDIFGFLNGFDVVYVHKYV